VTVFRLDDYLEHIRMALRQARDHVECMGKDEFLADVRTQQAVTMNLIIIGEAATGFLPMMLPLCSRTLSFHGVKFGECAIAWHMGILTSISTSSGTPYSKTFQYCR
jgi:hypothetical protein